MIARARPVFRSLAMTRPLAARMPDAGAVQVPALCRGIVVVRNTESKVRGLRKDPETYMTSPAGVLYPGTNATFEHVRKFLGDKWQLTDAALLQAVTHKSFAHGKKPYNEKLATFGNQLLRVSVARAAAEAGEGLPRALLINGRNFDVSSHAVEMLSASQTLAEVADRAALQDSLFWRPADEGGRGAATVKARAVNALVGAVQLEHGTAAAAEFVEARLLQGPYSVFDIAGKLLAAGATPSSD